MENFEVFVKVNVERGGTGIGTGTASGSRDK